MFCSILEGAPALGRAQRQPAQPRQQRGRRVAAVAAGPTSRTRAGTARSCAEAVELAPLLAPGCMHLPQQEAALKLCAPSVGIGRSDLATQGRLEYSQEQEVNTKWKHSSGGLPSLDVMTALKSCSGQGGVYELLHGSNMGQLLSCPCVDVRRHISQPQAIVEWQHFHCKSRSATPACFTFPTTALHFCVLVGCSL